LEDRTRRLKEVLDIAREQRVLLDRGDLKAVESLQATRQQLLQGIQSFDAQEGEERSIAAEVLRIDQSLRLLLLSEVGEIEKKMQKISAVRKLFHTRRSSRRGTPRYVSRRI
jgi:hypothetical protein